jgi:hypothetical protein
MTQLDTQKSLSTAREITIDTFPALVTSPSGWTGKLKLGGRLAFLFFVSMFLPTAALTRLATQALADYPALGI